MRRSTAASLILSILFTDTVCVSPPGKPRITMCRSPEKETFTCWWEPSYDGGLPTTYALYYRLENAEKANECPDYHTGGENSCFFSKNDTIIWVTYNITVVATNKLGSTCSDPIDVDVVYIVQPHTPTNVTVLVKEDEQGPYMRVSWEKPSNADTVSGWITLIYQLRVKLKNQEEWEEHDAGQQKSFNVFSPHSGGTYMVQVRCKPDHGLWSEWSATTYVNVPDYMPRERSVWIVIAVLTLFAFVILTWTLNLKRSSLKHCLLPPVPGPKIKGFDQKLLKDGTSEDMFNALVIPGFPPSSSEYDDLLVEYLEVYDDDQEMDGKDLQEGCLKLKSLSDDDSGRGSCDSHTLLLDKCGPAKEEPPLESPQKEVERKALRGFLSTEAQSSTAEHTDGQTTEAQSSTGKPANGQTSAWPVVLSSDQNNGSPLKSGPDGGISPPTYFQHEHNVPTGSKHNKVHHECSVDSSESKGDVVASPARIMEYVEVQKVNQQNVLLLKLLAEHNDTSVELPGEDYGKVKGVTTDNVLLLQQAASTQCLSDYHDGDRQEEPCPMMEQTHMEKPIVHNPPTVVHGGMQLTSNGYVDTMMPTY